MLPKIVGETSEATEGPNKQMEPVSESNRFDFDLLADYNPDVPVEHKIAKKPAKDESAKTTAGPANTTPGIHAHRVLPGPHAAPDKHKPVAPKPQIPKPNPAIKKVPGGPQ
jgi:hypothetical protein